MFLFVLFSYFLFFSMYSNWYSSKESSCKRTESIPRLHVNYWSKQSRIWVWMVLLAVLSWWIAVNQRNQCFKKNVLLMILPNYASTLETYPDRGVP